MPILPSIVKMNEFNHLLKVVPMCGLTLCVNTGHHDNYWHRFRS